MWVGVESLAYFISRCSWFYHLVSEPPIFGQGWCTRDLRVHAAWFWKARHIDLKTARNNDALISNLIEINREFKENHEYFELLIKETGYLRRSRDRKYCSKWGIAVGVRTSDRGRIWLFGGLQRVLGEGASLEEPLWLKHPLLSIPVS